jgi:hypothetical protein
MKTKEEVLSLLLALGASKEEVANKLHALGIRGKRRECSSCPIAQFLAKNDVGVGVGVAVAVGVGVWVGVEYYSYLLRHYPAIAPIQTFIHAFDRGEFPQLEEAS